MTETVERTEVLLPGPAEALSLLLDVPMPKDGLAPLWHWIYLLDHPAQADLGPDGHPVRNSVPLPPNPGLRRMWAGGRVRVEGPLRFGEPATRRTSVIAVQEKQSRTGTLVFVTVGHLISQGGRVAVDERQDLVYREPATAHRVPDCLAAQDEYGTPGESAASRRPVAPDESGDTVAHARSDVPGQPDAHGRPVLPNGSPAPGEWELELTPPLLFRFSALTYNAHRIHYDRDYARDAEGYPGLLVHGPLQALLMAELARAHEAGRLHGWRIFEYRLQAPLFVHQGLIVAATPDEDGVITSVRDHSGRQTASGRILRG
jgi:3-methylfumaryl-CoA hydratase